MSFKTKIENFEFKNKGIVLYFKNEKGQLRQALVTYKGMRYLGCDRFFIGDEMIVEKRIYNDKIFYMVKKMIGGGYKE